MHAGRSDRYRWSEVRTPRQRRPEYGCRRRPCLDCPADKDSLAMMGNMVTGMVGETQRHREFVAQWAGTRSPLSSTTVSISAPSSRWPSSARSRERPRLLAQPNPRSQEGLPLSNRRRESGSSTAAAATAPGPRPPACTPSSWRAGSWPGWTWPTASFWRSGMQPSQSKGELQARPRYRRRRGVKGLPISVPPARRPGVKPGLSFVGE